MGDLKTLFIVSGILIALMSISIVYQTKMMNNETKLWPPHISRCPEYWNISSDPELCENTSVSFKNRVSTGNNTTLAYNGNNLEEVKANQGLNYYHWDGITNT